MKRRNPYQGYVYPFTHGAIEGRIDQGLDVGGSGAILAIGKAKITSVGRPAGWPGTGGIVYQLLEGPMAGHHVYVYEGVKPSVRAGQIVNPGQAIGSIIPGTSTGIEMGWSTAAGVPLAHAEYTEGKETRFGKAFERFLHSLPAGPGKAFREMTPVERAKIGAIAKEENLKPGLPGPGEIASEVLSGIFGAIHPEALMLNIGLIGGGAFLVYYGAALMLGVKRPVKPIAEAAGAVATKGAVK